MQNLKEKIAYLAVGAVIALGSYFGFQFYQAFGVLAQTNAQTTTNTKDIKIIADYLNQQAPTSIIPSTPEK